MKLRWQPTIAALFRPNGGEKTLKPAGVLLYMRIATFLWWFGSFRWPDMGDRRRERESPARGERDSEILLRCEREHGTPVQLKVGSRMNGSFGCDWLDLEVDRTVQTG